MLNQQGAKDQARDRRPAAPVIQSSKGSLRRQRADGEGRQHRWYRRQHVERHRRRVKLHLSQMMRMAVLPAHRINCHLLVSALAAHRSHRRGRHCCRHGVARARHDGAGIPRHRHLLAQPQQRHQPCKAATGTRTNGERAMHVEATLAYRALAGIAKLAVGVAYPPHWGIMHVDPVRAGSMTRRHLGNELVATQPTATAQ